MLAGFAALALLCAFARIQFCVSPVELLLELRVGQVVLHRRRWALKSFQRVLIVKRKVILSGARDAVVRRIADPAERESFACALAALARLPLHRADVHGVPVPASTAGIDAGVRRALQTTTPRVRMSAGALAGVFAAYAIPAAGALLGHWPAEDLFLLLYLELWFAGALFAVSLVWPIDPELGLFLTLKLLAGTLAMLTAIAFSIAPLALAPLAGDGNLWTPKHAGPGLASSAVLFAALVVLAGYVDRVMRSRGVPKGEGARFLLFGLVSPVVGGVHTLLGGDTADALILVLGGRLCVEIAVHRAVGAEGTAEGRAARLMAEVAVAEKGKGPEGPFSISSL